MALSAASLTACNTERMTPSRTEIVCTCMCLGELSTLEHSLDVHGRSMNQLDSHNADQNEGSYSHLTASE